MFALSSGTTNRPKTIPVTRESLQNYRDGWTNWGILAFDAHPPMIANGLMPILQLASDWRESFTPAGIPCGAITGLTAHMQNPLGPDHLLHAAGRVEDQGHRLEVLPRDAAIHVPLRRCGRSPPTRARSWRSFAWATARKRR